MPDEDDAPQCEPASADVPTIVGSSPSHEDVTCEAHTPPPGYATPHTPGGTLQAGPVPLNLQKFGEFEVIAKIGQGGMGAVYRARQISLDRMVALKLLPADLQDDEHYIGRFQREATLAAQLNHANIVRVFSFGEIEGSHYIAMELIEGENLRQRLKGGALEPLEALRICAEVARGLQHGWQTAQIIHRDIKPANLFLSKRGDVKVGDLGLAKSLLTNTSGLTQTGTSMGTAHYMSPEQARGEKPLDVRADIYSLGCTLYEMLTGRPPYEGTDGVSIIHQHLHAPLPAILKVMPGCPIPLARLVGKMLKKQRHERQQNYEELLEQIASVTAFIEGGGIVPGAEERVAMWRQASGGAPNISVTRPPAEPAATSVSSKSRLPLLVAAALLAVFAVAGAVYFLKPKPVAPRSGPTGFEAAAALAAREQAQPAAATKDTPFVNTLGMKFVPVPIGGGPTKGDRVLFSIWDTRVRDYAEYAAANPQADDWWKKLEKDGLPVGREPEHPVVAVSWKDAQAFCQWLTAKETAEGKLPQGMKYRLPSDEEWSWAVGLPPEVGGTPEEKSGKNTVDFPWGKDWPPTKKVGNYADETFHANLPLKKNENDNRMEKQWIKGYTDGNPTASPVGSFPANAYGLYDMGGNVWQWCEDWFDASYTDRVGRGAAWPYFSRSHLLSSARNNRAPGLRQSHTGFRCVLASPPPASSGVSAPAGSAAAMKFPPGQWVKVFTKPEDLPDLRTPENGVKWEDGWINLGSNSRLLRLPASLGGNYAIRARFRRGEAESNAIVMRYQGGSGGQYYQFRLANDAIICQRRVNDATYKSVIPSARVLPPALGHEYVMEVGAVGARLIARMNGDKCTTGTDTEHLQGAAHIRCNELLRDIEVINLDSLPEAEALRLLGVDEQGHDLRGKPDAATTPGKP